MMFFDCNIILASNSPRRKELLKLIFDDYKIVNSEIDEEQIEKEILKQQFNNNIEKFQKICEEIARAKCEAVAKTNQEALVISADTIVYDGEKLFGKPYNKEKAIAFLEYLSGKKHTVQTSFCIYYKNEYHLFTEKSFVTFKELDEEQKENIRKYVEIHKPYDKSGSYGIQDNENNLIKDFQGDLFNIVGLPISRLFRELYLLSTI